MTLTVKHDSIENWEKVIAPHWSNMKLLKYNVARMLLIVVDLIQIYSGFKGPEGLHNLSHLRWIGHKTYRGQVFMLDGWGVCLYAMIPFLLQIVCFQS